jgi:endoglucanase
MAAASSAGQTTASPVASATPAVSVDTTVSAIANHQVSVTVSDSTTNELVVALVSANSGKNGTERTWVSGGGLVWALVGRENAQLGAAEIWSARAAGQLSNARVTSVESTTNDYTTNVAMTVMTFNGAAIGAYARNSSASGPPTVSLMPKASGSLVFGVGFDWDSSTNRTMGSGQAMVYQQTDTYGDTFWMQSLNAPTTAGSSVTVNDTAPVGDRFDMEAVEVTSTGITPPTTTTTTSLPTTTTTGATTTTSTTLPTTTTTGATTTTSTTLPTTTTTMATTTTTKPPPPPPGTPSLAVVGNHLVDGNGKTIVLRGVNRSGGEYGCVQWGGTFDGPSDDASAAAIASWHTNIVRMGLNEDCWLGINGEPTGGLTAAQYQSDIKSFVKVLHNHGLAVILELHWTAPGGYQATSQEAMPDADHSPAFWTSVANSFKGDPGTVFDLFNEPTNVDWNCWQNGCATSGRVGGRGTWQAAGMQSLVDAVRGTGATNVIMLGGLQYANDLTGWLSHQPNDPLHQTAASFHVYDFNACNSVSCWNAQVAPVAGAVPVVSGEIGESDNSANFINSYMGWADPKGMGYTAWVWDTWGCGGNVLISNYNGTACNGYGSGYQTHLVGLP